jgi:hypothetical protein
MRFQRIADTLEIQGENPFKVRAHRRAVDAIEDLPGAAGWPARRPGTVRSFVANSLPVSVLGESCLPSVNVAENLKSTL